MNPEQHDVISRVDAWAIWQHEVGTYGEHVVGDLDSSLDRTTLTPAAAACVVVGADEYDQKEMLGEPLPFQDAQLTRELLGSLKEKISAGRARRVSRLILESNERQNTLVQELRSREIEDGFKFVKTLGSVAMDVANEGYWTTEQADEMAARLIAPDGTPMMQHTPMTMLEWARRATTKLQRIELGEDYLPDPLESFTTPEFNTGIIAFPMFLSNYDAGYAHWKVHERMHEISGVELYRSFGFTGKPFKLPSLRFCGVQQHTFSFEGQPGLLRAESGGTKLNEGETDDATQAMLRAMITRGMDVRVVVRNRYSKYVDFRQSIRQSNTELSEAITNAALAEATPQDPNRKRRELVLMHELANDAFDSKHALRDVRGSATLR